MTNKNIYVNEVKLKSLIIGVNNKSDFVTGFTIDNTKRSSIQDSLDAIQPAVYSELA